ncbi:MAG: glycosyltransferase family 4 protein [Gemmataceae bacterium]
MSASMKNSIGYIGVDFLNNATICNEALGLLDAGVPLEPASVYSFEKATFYRNKNLERITSNLHSLYPLKAGSVLWALLAGPFVFGWRFWKALGKACTCEVEGWSQRLRVVWGFLPALCLAMHWRTRNVGHIHAHWAHTATTMAMHAAELLDISFSFTGHANDLFVHTVGLPAKIRRARFIVCISEFHRRWYLERGADAERLHVVYCGIDPQRFSEAGTQEINNPMEGFAVPPAGENSRFSSGALPVESPTRKNDTPVILGVGRLVEKKGFHHLVAACAKLKDRGVNFQCIIAGKGDEESRLQELGEALGVTDMVTIPGTNVLQEDLPGLMRQARIIALPCVRDRNGDMDGLPQVLIEAMLCGVPVVSTRLVGIPDLIRDGENGYLVRPEDVDQLTAALEKAIGDPETTHQMGLLGKEWAQSHFGREKTVERLQQLFEWATSHSDQKSPGWQHPPAPGATDAYADPERDKENETKAKHHSADLITAS